MLLVAARKQKSVDVLEALASRHDVPEDVVEALSKEKNSKVRAAYAGRPDRSAEELAVIARSEKRVTVLAAVAGNPSTPPDVLAELSASDSSGVLRGVVENPRSPTTTRYEALVRLVRTAGYDWWMRSFVDQHVELHEFIARGAGRELKDADNTSVLVTESVISSPAISSEAQRSLWSKYLRPWLRYNVKRGQEDYQADRMIQVFATRLVLDPKVFQGLQEHAADPAWVVRPYVRQALQSALSTRTMLDPAGDEVLLQQAVATSDVSYLVDLASRLSAAEHLTPVEVEVACALARNPSTPASSLVGLVRYIRSSAVDSVALRCSEDRSLAVEFGAWCVDELFESAAFRSEPDKPGLLADVALRMAATLEGAGGSEVHSWRTLLTSGHADERVLQAAPWHLLGSGTLWGLDTPDHVSSMLNDALAESLGEDVERWEVFMSLSAGFVGSVGALLESARILSPAASELAS